MRIGAGKCVCMNRHEQIGALVARDGRTLSQREVVVAFARQLAAITRRIVEQSLQFLRNGERDVFLLHFADADGAGVLAAVTGIDRDDEVAQRTIPELASLRPALLPSVARGTAALGAAAIATVAFAGAGRVRVRRVPPAAIRRSAGRHRTTATQSCKRSAAGDRQRR